MHTNDMNARWKVHRAFDRNPNKLIHYTDLAEKLGLEPGTIQTVIGHAVRCGENIIPVNSIVGKHGPRGVWIKYDASTMSKEQLTDYLDNWSGMPDFEWPEQAS